MTQKVKLCGIAGKSDPTTTEWKLALKTDLLVECNCGGS